jgi:hypothetical protein
MEAIFAGMPEVSMPPKAFLTSLTTGKFYANGNANLSEHRAES